MGVLATQLKQLLKGVITPESVSIGGTLDAKISSKFIDRVKDESDFLKGIHWEKTSKIKETFKAFDIADESLVRTAEGTAPTDGQYAALDRAEIAFDNKKILLLGKILESTIDDNQDTPDFQQKVEAQYQKKMANEIQLLGFIGTADDYAASAFAALNKGWLQVAKETAPALQQKDTAGSVGNQTAIMDAMIAAMPAKHKKMGVTTFWLSPADWEDFCTEIGLVGGALAMFLVDGKVPTYKGYPVKPINQMPVGAYLFCEQENFWMTFLTQIKVKFIPKPEASCVLVHHEVYNDYGFINVDEVVVAWDQT